LPVFPDVPFPIAFPFDSVSSHTLFPPSRPWVAERFFLHDTSGRAASTSDVERTIGRLQKKLSRHQGVLTALNEKQATAQKSKQDAALAEKQSKLADAQKKAADAASELAALEAEVAKG
jgi:hypothetical protein